MLCQVSLIATASHLYELRLRARSFLCRALHRRSRKGIKENAAIEREIAKDRSMHSGLSFSAIAFELGFLPRCL